MTEEKIKQKQVRRKFSPEFKDQVLLRTEKDGVAAVQRILISKNRWFIPGVQNANEVVQHLKIKKFSKWK